MAINVDYGPISTAVQLATQAGRGQYWQNQQQEDDRFLSLANDMQRTADQRKATAMQDALGYSELQARQQQAQAELAGHDRREQWEQQYQNGELAVRKQALDNQKQQIANQADYHKGSLAARGDLNDIRQQQADTQQQRADTYNTRVQDLEGQVNNTRKDTAELRTLQAATAAAQKELTALMDPIASKYGLPTKREDVNDADWQSASQKFQQYQAMRDAKLQAMTAAQQPAADPMANVHPNPQVGGAPAPGAQPGGAGPGMPPAPMMGMQQPMPASPETKQQALQVAAASIGVRPQDVAQLPPPPQQVADQLKAMVLQQSSDPAQQRVMFYRLMIQAGMDPTKPTVQQQPIGPGQQQLPLRGQ